MLAATARAVAESSGLVHVPEEDHEARGTAWQVLESPYVRVFESFPDKARERVVDLEASVADSAETSAALAPVREALTRVERHVDRIDRERVDQAAVEERPLIALVVGKVGSCRLDAAVSEASGVHPRQRATAIGEFVTNYPSARFLDCGESARCQSLQHS